MATNKTKTPSTYNQNVNVTGRLYKEEMASVGAMRSNMLSNAKTIQLASSFAKVLRASKKDKELYENLNNAVPRNLKGMVSINAMLRVLQAHCEKGQSWEQLIEKRHEIEAKAIERKKEREAQKELERLAKEAESEAIELGAVA